MLSYIKRYRFKVDLSTRVLTVLAILFVSAVVTNINVSTQSAGATACGSEPTSTTGRSSQSITVPSNATYTIWSRLKAPSASTASYKAYINGQCFTIARTSLPAGVWTWVNHENGSTSDKATVTLPAGKYTLVLTAGTENLQLDRVMLLSTSCTPTGTGDNCADPVTNSTPATSGGGAVGVSNPAVENAGPNKGDANYDGKKDSHQSNVATLRNAKTNKYNTLVSKGDCSTFKKAVSSAQSKLKTVFGVWSFDLSCAKAGDKADITIYLDRQYAVNKWKVYKYNATLKSSRDITRRVAFATAVLGSKTVTTLSYSLTDGGELDQDGTKNGVIVDPLSIQDPSSTQSDLSLTGPGAIIYLWLALPLTLIVVTIVGYKLRRKAYVNHTEQVTEETHDIQS